MENEKLKEFSKNISIKFKDLSLLKTALTHRSYINEHPKEDLEHNERMEFLGDAVLELIVTEYLYSNYPERPEGDLTSFRSALVCTASLAETSQELKVGEYLQMSKGEEETGGREKSYLLANTFEALLGAIYLDKGMEESKRFVQRVLIPKIAHIVKNRLDINIKTKFQELSQEIYGETPLYDTIEEFGPDHNKTFIIEAKVAKKPLGKGEGKSKQEAEENAAEEAVKTILKEKSRKKGKKA